MEPKGSDNAMRASNRYDQESIKQNTLKKEYL